MTDKEIVLKSIIKSEDNSLVLNRYMSVDNFKAYIIFSHEFAKAFFGERNLYLCRTFLNSGWEYHLSKMVLEKEPLKYLEKFLN